MNEIMHVALESTDTSDPQLCHYQYHLDSTFYILQTLSTSDNNLMIRSSSSINPSRSLQELRLL
jgi:hypothetical protein